MTMLYAHTSYVYCTIQPFQKYPKYFDSSGENCGLYCISSPQLSYPWKLAELAVRNGRTKQGRLVEQENGGPHIQRYEDVHECLPVSCEEIHSKRMGTCSDQQDRLLALNPSGLMVSYHLSLA